MHHFIDFDRSPFKFFDEIINKRIYVSENDEPFSGPKNEPSKVEALVKTIMEDQFSMEAELIKEALDNVNSDSLRSFHKVCIFKMATKTYKNITIFFDVTEVKAV